MTHRTLPRLASAILILSLCASPALAHYLWVTVDAKTGEHGMTKIYFEGGAGPGDGQYLDPFIKRGKTWIRTGDKPVLVKMGVTKVPGKRWLSAALPSAAPRSIDSFGLWGVYRYGKTDVLLHYNARNIDAVKSTDVIRLAAAPHLDLAVVPRALGETLRFQVLWRGKPAVNRPVSVRGPKGFRATLKTDKLGRAQFPVKAPGQYLLRTSIEETDKSGTFEGKHYDIKRHHSTLLIKLAAAT